MMTPPFIAAGVGHGDPELNIGEQENQRQEKDGGEPGDTAGRLVVRGNVSLALGCGGRQIFIVDLRLVQGLLDHPVIEHMGEGGGLVLSAVHNIQPDVPLDNILAMFQHAREYVPSFAQ